MKPYPFKNNRHTDRDTPYTPFWRWYRVGVFTELGKGQLSPLIFRKFSEFPFSLYAGRLHKSFLNLYSSDKKNENVSTMGRKFYEGFNQHP